MEPMKLFFDTETTGIADFKRPAIEGPRIVQLGAILTDDNGKEHAIIDLLIKPDGWTVPAEAAKIHGITTEIATTGGVPLGSALTVFNELNRASQQLIAHNLSFDIFVLKGERARRGDTEMVHDAFCTMIAMTTICKIPGFYGKQYKWPKLQEAYKHCFGQEFDNAHSAIADVRACKEIYFWLKKNTP